MTHLFHDCFFSMMWRISFSRYIYSILFYLLFFFIHIYLTLSLSHILSAVFEFKNWIQFKRFSFYQRFVSYTYAFLSTFVFVYISILFFKSMYAKQNHLQYCLGDKCKIISAIFCFDLATSWFFFLDIVSWNNQTYISILTINLNYCFSFSLKSK